MVDNSDSVQTDIDRGGRFADLVNAPPERFHEGSDSYPLAPVCQAAAEAFYGAPMFDGELTASDAQQAFYYGCSGQPVGEFSQPRPQTLGTR